ncbi:CSG1/SUR1-like protein [Saxophila tyrrhenica]|uniref:CSG1/SUR1-like protein n=1 Tax=Saxophila tyrrhenica TaxID=1690608 RepID=A0AAV9P4N7_9PEZI|nr:CSG1/SUR1-like protein [Saxophila tyrrhenica]
MRRGLLIFLLLLFALLAFAIHTVWTLITLLFVTGARSAITKAELPSPNSSRIGTGPALIPKILHQTWQNESIPAVWKGAQQSCLDLHREEDGWEYMLWTDAKMEAFMRKEYLWFMETFDGYPYVIERADAIRYFVLYHYGGVYLDLDDGCGRAMEPLLSYPAWVRKTVPTGISNDAMGATPGHPFFRKVIDSLQAYDRNWLLPYITVMGSTGPLFLSVIWRHYSSEGLNEDDGEVRILFPDEYQGTPWAFFTHHLGNSWHGADVEFIFWMARNWFLVTLIGFALGFTIIFGTWWTYHRLVLKKPASDVPKWKMASVRSKFPFWRRASAQKEYELVSRHEV